MGAATANPALQALDDRASQLVKNINTTLLAAADGGGQMSSTLYDTAWIACIVKPDAAHHGAAWLFPDSFAVVLNAQQADGGWHWPPTQPHVCNGDCLISSLVACLALKLHADRPLQVDAVSDISQRLAVAQEYVNRICSEAHETLLANRGVAFEILAPALLRVLQSCGVDFKLPFLDRLSQLAAKKLAKLEAAGCSLIDSNICHSLEAFYGLPQFDCKEVRSRLVDGSVMGSPAATAAYLMSSDTWDDSAEAYLRRALKLGEGNGSGQVPSAFPSNIFETSWAVSTLLKSGWEPDTDTAEKVSNELSKYAEAGRGLLGFAPGMLADIDDTATTSSIISRLKSQSLCLDMIDNYQTSAHFRTYNIESNPSLSANCNALLALLDSPDHAQHLQHIRQAADFICAEVLERHGHKADKWNHSPLYSMMLTAQSLTLLLKVEEHDTLHLEEDLTARILAACSFCVFEILWLQNDNGSWGTAGVNEETSYALLALVSLSTNPKLMVPPHKLSERIQRGQKFLQGVDQAHKPPAPEYLWVEKVTFGSQILAESYRLSALIAVEKHFERQSQDQSSQAKKSMDANAGMAKKIGFLKRLPLLGGLSSDDLELSTFESMTFRPGLLRARTNVFERSSPTSIEYMDWIPLIWILIHNTHKRALTRTFLTDMMVFSMLVYQSDELMETAMPNQISPDAMRTQVNSIFDTSDQTASNKEGVNGTHDEHATYVKHSLQKLKEYIDTHKRLQLTSQEERAYLHHEAKRFLLAHIVQSEQNQQLKAETTSTTTTNDSSIHSPVHVLQNPSQTFADWIQHTSGIHTSCAVAFTFASSLLSHNKASNGHGAKGKPNGVFPTYEQKWIVSSLLHSLAAMCRMYNDIGSFQRDADESNVNSLNFAELHDIKTGKTTSKHDPLGAAKAKLKAIADFEREKVHLAINTLAKRADPQDLDMTRVFVGVTDLWGEIYVLRDLTSKHANKG